MNKKVTTIIILCILALLGLMGGCEGNETEYEKAGKEFSTWTKKDPSTWTDTQKKYLNDMLTYKDKNKN